MSEAQEVRGALNWRELDSVETIREYHQQNARNIRMGGKTGDTITPEAFIDVMQAARATLVAEPDGWPQLAYHLDVLLAGLNYGREEWEKTGQLFLLPYTDELGQHYGSPHAMAFSVLCAPYQPDEGNKKKPKARQRKRSQAVATSTAK